MLGLIAAITILPHLLCCSRPVTSCLWAAMLYYALKKDRGKSDTTECVLKSDFVIDFKKHIFLSYKSKLVNVPHQNTGLGLWDMFVEYHLWNPRVRCENFCDKNCIAELRKVATLAHAINDNCICSGEMGILHVPYVLEKTIFGPFAFRIPQVF